MKFALLEHRTYEAEKLSDMWKGKWLDQEGTGFDLQIEPAHSHPVLSSGVPLQAGLYSFCKIQI